MANDFSPVCAMTGRPAETWRKFTFSTPPAWTYALLVLICLGLLGVAIAGLIIYAVSERATGHLPLTRSSKRLADLAFWGPIGLLIASPIAWVLAFVFGSSDNQSPVLPILFLIGIALLVAGLLFRLVGTPLISPRGKVFPVQFGQYDRLVRISNVSPAFVAAVRERQHAQYAQAYSQPVSQLPDSK
jgi:MFS family permease